jgi:hypothetical protein
MLSRAQQILIKRAQREAALQDEEYREALQTVSGCRSSTDPRMTDRHVDLVLAYLEAIYFRKRGLGELQANCNVDSVFKNPGYWASKNPRQRTSRDRYTFSKLSNQIASAEAALADLGFGEAYCAAIRRKTCGESAGVRDKRSYLAALQRTLNSKQKILAGSQIRQEEFNSDSGESGSQLSL